MARTVPPIRYAHGFIRVEPWVDDEIVSLYLAMGARCKGEGLHLRSIILRHRPFDREADDGGLGELLLALRMPKVDAVIVPNLRHVAPDPACRAALTAMIRDTETRILSLGRRSSPSWPAVPG